MDDAERIAALYRQHLGAARSLAVALTGDVGLAEDITQDAFVRCARRLSALSDASRFRGYLLRSVVHAATDEHRRRLAEQRSVQRAGSHARTTQEDAPTGLAADLVAALQQLPMRQRTAVAARFLFDWSEAETARAMRCRVGTVKSLTSRGLATLRAAMDPAQVDHD